VPIVENEAGWRTITGYAGGNDAYAVVVDTTGVVRWQTHEKVTDRTYLNLKQAVESARSGIGH
jgi:hypothetical protein